MVNHDETIPWDREDRNAPITAAENPASSPKRGCFKKTTPFTEEHQGGAQPVALTERRNVTIKDEQMTPL